jgi:phage regulator Rha-like protein
MPGLMFQQPFKTRLVQRFRHLRHSMKGRRRGSNEIKKILVEFRVR